MCARECRSVGKSKGMGRDAGVWICQGAQGDKVTKLELLNLF